jgi:hypothetical protein
LYGGQSRGEGRPDRYSPYISITLDTYSHVLPNMQEEAAEKVAALIFGS